MDVLSFKCATPGIPWQREVLGVSQRLVHQLFAVSNEGCRIRRCYRVGRLLAWCSSLYLLHFCSWHLDRCQVLFASWGHVGRVSPSKRADRCEGGTPLIPFSISWTNSWPANWYATRSSLMLECGGCPFRWERCCARAIAFADRWSS